MELVVVLLSIAAAGIFFYRLKLVLALTSEFSRTHGRASLSHNILSFLRDDKV